MIPHTQNSQALTISHNTHHKHLKSQTNIHSNNVIEKLNSDAKQCPALNSYYMIILQHIIATYYYLYYNTSLDYVLAANTTFGYRDQPFAAFLLLCLF